MTIRAGVVGLGFMGRRYTDFLQRMPEVELAAICDIQQDLMQEVSRECGATPFADAEELVTSPEIDAVFICTPEHHHVEVAVPAIEAGKAVMIEKPIAHTLDAARTIVEAARAGESVIMVGHVLRFEPRWAAARRVVAAGELGEIRTITTRRIGNILDQQILQGRTSIPLYYGVHDLDIVRWLAGSDAETIMATRQEGVLQNEGYPVADLYVTHLEFANGVLATAELGWHVPEAAVDAPTSGVTVVGTKGWLRIEQADTGLSYWSEDGQRPAHPVFDVAFWSDVHGVPTGALANELRHFLDCVRTQKQPIISLEDAVEALRLALAMELAADRGERVHLAATGSWDLLASS